MTKAIIAAAVLLSALNYTDAALAWHFQSKRACLRHAVAPHCEPHAVAVCKARSLCRLTYGKTIIACIDWKCEHRR